MSVCVCYPRHWNSTQINLRTHHTLHARTHARTHTNTHTQHSTAHSASRENRNCTHSRVHGHIGYAVTSSWRHTRAEMEDSEKTACEDLKREVGLSLCLSPSSPQACNLHVFFFPACAHNYVSVGYTVGWCKLGWSRWGAVSLLFKFLLVSLWFFFFFFLVVWLWLLLLF